MGNKYEVMYPLDLIHFVSGNDKLHLFLNYLFKKAVEFNEENKVAKGDNFFPIATYNSKQYSFDFEYEFFVKTFVDFLVQVYEIDKESESRSYSYLYSSIDKKIVRSRLLFFTGVLGNYHGLGSAYYNDPSKNTRQIYFHKIVKNSSGNKAESKIFMIRDFVKEHIKDGDVLNKLKSYSLEQVAYGKAKIAEYKEKNSTDEEPIIEIYKIHKF